MVDRRVWDWGHAKLKELVGLGMSRSGMPHGTPAELRRVAAATVLRQILTRVIEDEVAAALRSGATWDDIGTAIGGKTKQAAQKRFGHLR